VSSLRRRLLAILLALFGAAWLLLAASSFVSAHLEIEELFDAQLAQQGRVLLGLTLHELEEVDDDRPLPDPDVIGRQPGHDYEEKIAFQVWRRAELLARSANAPRVPLAAAAGFSDQVIDGQAWRVFTLHDPGTAARVSVAERYAVRDELIAFILLNTLWPVLLAAPLLAMLIWTGVGRGLAPLKRLAREIGRRTPRDLGALDAAGAPAEVRPLVGSLNDLLARLAEALEAERRFTANAAHELRTPLATLRAQAQVAQRAATEAERRQVLAQILRGVDRATHLVAQMLTLARVDPQAAAERHVVLDLAALARDAVAELAPQAIERQVEIALAEDSRGRVAGDAAALAILLRNLIDNAIRYTPAGGRVEVAVAAGSAAVELTVCDTGPGIPAAERAQVFERFYRLPGSGADGCGLGLSIVRRIVELHGATIELGTPPWGAGLAVRVRFAAAEPGPAGTEGRT
jgi:two-component system sensor histidine kinase QseC